MILESGLGGEYRRFQGISLREEGYTNQQIVWKRACRKNNDFFLQKDLAIYSIFFWMTQ